MLETFAPQTFVGNHDVTRIASRLREPRHLAHALAVLFTVGGTPSVYAGDERAWRGVKEEREGGDDAVRPVFPATPSDLGPEGLPVQRLHQTLIGVRRRNAWLARAQACLHTVGHAVLSYTLTDPDSGRAVAVALNYGSEPPRPRCRPPPGRIQRAIRPPRPGPVRCRSPARLEYRHGAADSLNSP